MSPREAWRLTEREVSLLRRRQEERLAREEAMVGALWAAMVNPHRQKGQRPFTPADLFPRLRQVQHHRDPRELFQKMARHLKAQPEPTPET